MINIPKLSSLYAILVVSLSSTSVQSQDSAHSKEKRSLAVQGKSGYVTDRSRWGKLIFDPAQIKVRGGSAEDVSAIATLIEKYHRAWLSRDAVATATLLDADVVRFRGNSARFGSAAVLKRMARESRGERPEGYAGSTELALRDVQLSIDGDTATAFYRIDTHVGARWEFSDLLTVKQAFHQTDGRWTLFHHVESERLDDRLARFDEGAQVAARVFRVRLHGQHVIAQGKHCVWAVIGAADQPRAGRQLLDLILMREEHAHAGERRLHPRLLRSDGNFLHADAPAAFAAAYFASKGLGNHLVPETNAHGFAFVRVEGHNELLKVLYPILLLEHRSPRAAGEPRIAFAGVGWQIAFPHSINPQFGVNTSLPKQMSNHFRNAAIDAVKLRHHKIALEQADFHSALW